MTDLWVIDFGNGWLFIIYSRRTSKPLRKERNRKWLISDQGAGFIAYKDLVLAL